MSASVGMIIVVVLSRGTLGEQRGLMLGFILYQEKFVSWMSELMYRVGLFDMDWGWVSNSDSRFAGKWFFNLVMRHTYYTYSNRNEDI